MAKPSQDIGTRGVEEVVIVELAGSFQFVDPVDSFVQSGAHRDCCSIVKTDDGRPIESQEFLIKASDPHPICVCRRGSLRVQCSDRGLKLVRADTTRA